MPEKSRLSIIAAVARNSVIGRNGKLPWHLSSDLKRFRALTLGHHILMGRKTYESIGRPLPGRKSIVISRNTSFSAPGCLNATSLTQALALAQADNEVFVIGGAALYREALPLAQRLYLTEVLATVAGDTFFPALQRAQWREITRQHVPASEDNDFASDFVIYDRVLASPMVASSEVES